jgi:aminoglycoside 6'-N-acetyltransferase I
MSVFRVRPVEAGDAGVWTALRTALWPEKPEDHGPEVATFLTDRPGDAECFVAEDAGGCVVGFAEVGLRGYAEGCASSPVGYLEGIYVVADARRRGVGRRLVEAGEAWSRARGCTEMASDRALVNEASGAFHLAVGYAEAHRVVCYRKELRR